METLTKRVNKQTVWSRQAKILSELFRSRDFYEVSNIEYDLTCINSMDINYSSSLLLSGLSNGSIDIQEIVDLNYGNLEQSSHMKLSKVNLHRVQWYPGGEQFFSALDNSTLFLVDPFRLQVVDKLTFNMNSIYSEWNANNDKIIAVCGSESQIRLVDIQSGSSAQTIILSAPSQLSTHRATRCLWSKEDLHCLIVGDNEGYLHIFDTRHTRLPLVISDDDSLSQISCLSFANNSKNFITAHGCSNRLVEWSTEDCKLNPNKDKFRKLKKEAEFPIEDAKTTNNHRYKTSNQNNLSKTKKGESKINNKLVRKIPNIPGSSFLKCQLFVADKLLFCPAPSNAKKSKELYIYDLEFGTKLKTLKSDRILCKGISSVVGLLPESSVIFVGGQRYMKIWTFDENYKIKLEEKTKKFHTDHWDSD